jgi:cyclophilin family peptidyl-prolyl cis-trans isomerase
VLAQLRQAFPEQVRVVYRHFPLDFHDKALLSAQAAEAAGLQGKFWEMHDLIFARLGDWSELTLEQYQPWLIERAGELGLEVNQFSQDLNSEAIVNMVKSAQQRGQEIGLPGTPFLVANGNPYQGATDLDSLTGLVNSYLLKERQFIACPPMQVDPNKKYTATLKTEKGDIVIELLPKQAPMAVNSFIFLARQGWFDGVPFHRVIPGFVAQSGDPSGSGMGGPGYQFDNEISADLKYDRAGMVGMANSGAGTNGSQFFITYAAQPNLDGNYTIFGRVISGMEVVQMLAPRDPSQGGSLPTADKILSVVIKEE